MKREAQELRDEMASHDNDMLERIINGYSMGQPERRCVAYWTRLQREPTPDRQALDSVGVVLALFFGGRW